MYAVYMYMTIWAHKLSNLYVIFTVGYDTMSNSTSPGGIVDISNSSSSPLPSSDQLLTKTIDPSTLIDARIKVI